jgi:hypothetical protein
MSKLVDAERVLRQDPTPMAGIPWDGHYTDEEEREFDRRHEIARRNRMLAVGADGQIYQIPG